MIAESRISPSRSEESSRFAERNGSYAPNIPEIIDRERARLGRELHDGLCQTLAGIAALSVVLKRELASGDSGSSGAAGAAEITQLLNAAIVETRDMASGLNPLERHPDGLSAALSAFSLDARSRFRVICVFRCNSALDRMDPNMELQLFRIAQEAVRNAVDHGRASRIVISLRIMKTQGLLMVSDNGKGISADAEPGQGSRTMQFRADEINGSHTIGHRRAGGTRVSCVFDLPSPLPE